MTIFGILAPDKSELFPVEVGRYFSHPRNTTPRFQVLVEKHGSTESHLNKRETILLN